MLDLMEYLINKSSEKMIIVVQRPDMSMKYRFVEVLLRLPTFCALQSCLRNILNAKNVDFLNILE